MVLTRKNQDKKTEKVEAKRKKDCEGMGTTNILFIEATLLQ